jgi:protein-S-isoprenylcysteine O-methyltransferase Ste14
LGLLITGLGYFYIGLASYSPLPKPKKSNVLSRKGIFKYTRHPIYAGLMLMGFSFLLSRFVLLPTIFFVLFILITDVKANLEEELLIKKHPKYKEYKRKVKKYIPFIF